jgi:carbon starvation protein
MVILLAVLSLVVVNALAESPWGVFTVGATIPIALFLGLYLRFGRVGRVREATAIGVVLLLLAVWGGQYAHHLPALARALTFKPEPIAWAIIVYGLAASVLPIWLLLAPRDYLSTFMKLGTIFALAAGIFILLPYLKMPALTRFVDGSGPVVPGKVFPFCFITIACGAVSGFHSLIASGTTPKIITRESYARPIGYGAMCLESLVAVMAVIAACALDPGVYLSMNLKGAPETTVARVTAWNYPVTREQMDQLAQQNGEKTLFGRTGGAATLAVGMAQIFSRVTGGRGTGLWYHFAIMFEALFILTTLDAGTRVGRYLLQDMLGNVWKPFGDTRNLAANVAASALIVAAWGWFLIQGVRDANGGVNSLWPLFGIANQMLAGIALCLATTVILKMQLAPAGSSDGREKVAGPGKPASARRHPAFALVTLLPLVWLLAATMTAGYQKIFDVQDQPDRPRIGFLQIARELDARLPVLNDALSAAKAGGDTAAVQAAEAALQANRAQHFNNLLDAAVAGLFMVMVGAIAILSVWDWAMLLSRRRSPALRESEPVWLPEYAVAESRSVPGAGAVALGCLLAKELSGEAHLDRAQQMDHDANCVICSANADVRSKAGVSRKDAYVRMTERRFTGVNRCC